MARATTTAVTSFRHSMGNDGGLRDHGIKEAVQNAPGHSCRHISSHGAAAQYSLSDDEAGQANDHDPGSAVDIRRFLVLAHHSS